MTDQATRPTLDEFTEARRRYWEARDALVARQEAAIKVRYAELRAEDRAAGKDTSGKSVQERRLRAYHATVFADDFQAESREVERLWDEYLAIKARWS